MSNRISTADLEKAVFNLNRDTNSVHDFSLNWDYGQPRLCRKNQSIDVSPRGTKAVVYQYVSAMQEMLYLTEKTDADVFYITDAPVEYDYHGTKHLTDLTKKHRLVTMRPDNAEYQIGRYRSGMYVTFDTLVQDDMDIYNLIVGN